MLSTFSKEQANEVLRAIARNGKLTEIGIEEPAVDPDFLATHDRMKLQRSTETGFNREYAATSHCLLECLQRRVLIQRRHFEKSPTFIAYPEQPLPPGSRWQWTTVRATVYAPVPGRRGNVSCYLHREGLASRFSGGALTTVP